jgi:hypothetical protein
MNASSNTIPATITSLLALLLFPGNCPADALDTWVPRQSGTLNGLNGIVRGNGQFVVLGEGGTIMSSADSVNWTVRSSGTTNELSSVAYGGGQFVAVGTEWIYGANGEVISILGIILTSADRVNWTQQRSGLQGLSQGVAYGNGVFVAVGDGISVSVDGVNWVPKNFDTPDHLRSVTYGNGQFVAVGIGPSATATDWGGLILTSPDGVNWVRRQAGTRTLYGVAYGNGQFVAVGGDFVGFPGDEFPQEGILLSSADAANWVERSVPTNSILTAVAYGNGEFVAVNRSRTRDCILTSADAVTWVGRQAPAPTANFPLLGVAYGDGHFIAVGWGGTILESGPVVNLVIAKSAVSGRLTMSLTGPTDVSYTIQNSTDLISWQTLTNVPATQTNPVILNVFDAPTHAFYRAYSP